MGLTQSPIKWVPGVKHAGRETDLSPLSGAEVKTGRAKRFHGVVLTALSSSDTNCLVLCFLYVHVFVLFLAFTRGYFIIGIRAIK